MAKAIVRLDNVSATRNGALIKSAKYMGSGTTEAAIENGSLVAIGGLMDGQREVHAAITPTATTGYFGLVCTPEVEYDESGYHGLDTYENKSGNTIRTIILQTGDIFSVTEEALSGTPAKGKIVELQAGTKGKVVTTVTAGSTKVGEIIAVETVGRFTYYVIEVK